MPDSCNPMDRSPPGSSVHEISQARVLEWVAISFSRDRRNPGIEHGSPASQIDSLPAELRGHFVRKVHLLCSGVLLLRGG